MCVVLACRLISNRVQCNNFSYKFSFRVEKCTFNYFMKKKFKNDESKLKRTWLTANWNFVYARTQIISESLLFYRATEMLQAICYETVSSAVNFIIWLIHYVLFMSLELSSSLL